MVLVGNDGKNGIDVQIITLNGGEGQAGTRGYAAKDGVAAAGGNGGTGGNGSDGLAVNPQLMTELYGATGDLAEAIVSLQVQSHLMELFLHLIMQILQEILLP